MRKRKLISLANKFNVSYTFLTARFGAIACVRHRRRLYRLTVRGFPLLKLGRVQMRGNSKIRCLRRVPTMSYVFLSPTHHGRRNKGAMTVSSYRPGMTALRGLLLRGNGRMVVGLSPVLSLSLTVQSVRRMSRTRVISIGGRYGRLLLLLQPNSSSPRVPSTVSRPVIYVGFTGRRVRHFIFAHRSRRTARYSCARRVKACLCRPGTSVLGTNTFHDVTSSFRLDGLRTGDRLCASGRQVRGFPKHVFQVANCSNLGGGRLGGVLGKLSGTGVAAHGFPRSMTRLQGQLGLASKNSVCLFTAALGSREGVVVQYRGTWGRRERHHPSTTSFSRSVCEGYLSRQVCFV